MNEYNAVLEWNEPGNIVREKKDFISEMSSADHAFLCGLLKKCRPSKILEIGVAEGGTTAVIMQSLKMLDIRGTLYSVDLSERFYIDQNLETGYFYKNNPIESGYNHQFILGSSIAEVIDEIGKGIDFVVMDTMHLCPGELLDYLAIYPYLSDNCMVVLHDINMTNFIDDNMDLSVYEWRRLGYATRLLLSLAKGQKYMNFSKEFYNIGAFEVDKTKGENIFEIFWGLTMPWGYNPTEEMLEIYKKHFLIHYDRCLVDLFEDAIKYDCNNRRNPYFGCDFSILKMLPFNKIPIGSKIALYGAGNVGKKLKNIIKIMNLYDVAVWVDMDYVKYREQGYDVNSPDCIKNVEYILIGILNETIYTEVKKTLMYRGFEEKSIIGLI